MYEIFEKLLEVFGITIYKFCKETKISESAIYTWKSKKSIVRHEIAEKNMQLFWNNDRFSNGTSGYD